MPAQPGLLARRWRALFSLALLAAAWPAPAATITVNSTADTAVSDTALTLREALKVAEGTLGSSSAPLSTEEKNQISGANFSSLGGGRWMVTPLQNVGAGKADTIIFNNTIDLIMIQSGLPSLQPQDSLDGSRGLGQRVILDGSQGGNIGGLIADKGASSGRSVKNLILRNFTGDAIRAASENNGVFSSLDIYGNGGRGLYLPSKPTGTQIVSCRVYNNSGNGIQLEGDASDTGTSDMNNSISTCYVGLDAAGAAQGNKQNGIQLLYVRGNTVDNCAISANLKDGIQISGANAFNNSVTNCTIGLNPARTAKMGNALNGVTLVSSAHDNTIGGLAADNYISGSVNGIYVSGNKNLILGNVLGLNSGATAALGNTSYGIRVTGSNNTIGITNVGNTICASGIGVSLEGSGNVVANCMIGTTASGRSGLGNAKSGIYISGNTNTVGGSTLDYGNVISGNGTGILIEGTSAYKNAIFKNNIGTDEAGAGAIPNQSGVTIQSGAFNNEIGTTGKGNVIAGNSGDGIHLWGGTTSANQINGNTIGGIVGNGGNGIKIENSPNNKIGLTSPNTIAHNFDGIQITGAEAKGNLVSQNIIGLSADQSTKMGNVASGVSLLSGASSNTIGGSAAGTRNVIAGNTGCGVYISDTGTKTNLIFGNRIGSNDAGALSLGNGGAGVGIYNGASQNAVGGAGSSFTNVIGGNGGPGVDLASVGTSGNTVQGNKIGTNAAGSAAIPNGSGGVRIYGGATGNVIGGSFLGQDNLIGGNTNQGVGIYNTGSTGNTVQNNRIGVNAAGTAALPNTGEGVVIQEGAASNFVRGNLISGNNRMGVNINGAGTNGNHLSGNTIGLNPAGTAALANSGAGISVSGGAKNNLIGESGLGMLANVISGNTGYGVVLDGPGTSGNVVFNCVIGLNAALGAAVANGLSGVLLSESASGNTVGGKLTGSGATLAPANIIAGNKYHGVEIIDPGTSGNTVCGNAIGLNAALATGLGNKQYGVLLDSEASGNIIGGNAGYGNVIGNNLFAGVGIVGLARGNVVAGNMIGCTPADQNGVYHTAPNQRGGVTVGNQAIGNVIGTMLGGIPNLISGNRGKGVSISDLSTSGTVVMNNVIGLDPTGTAKMPNQDDGIYIGEGSTCTTVQWNTISGNGVHGIELDGGPTTPTISNKITQNKIGTGPNGSGALGNDGCGIYIANAFRTTIGGTTASLGNTIAYNEHSGVRVVKGTSNTIRCNSIHHNRGLGIDLGVQGPDPNDLDDTDTGPNDLLNAPDYLRLKHMGSDLLLLGTLTNTKIKFTYYTLEVFTNDQGHSSGYGEGQTIVSSKKIYLRSSNEAYFAIRLPLQYAGKTFSATVTDTEGNTSEFSRDQYNAADDWRGYR